MQLELALSINSNTKNCSHWPKKYFIYVFFISSNSTNLMERSGPDLLQLKFKKL